MGATHACTCRISAAYNQACLFHHLRPNTGTLKPFQNHEQVDLPNAGYSGIQQQADQWGLPLPKTLTRGMWPCRLVMSKLADQQGWAKAGGWAFDGRKNIYTPSEWLPPHEVLHTVRPSLPSSCLPAYLPPPPDYKLCRGSLPQYMLAQQQVV